MRIKFNWSSQGIDLMKQIVLESNMKSLKDDKEYFEKLLRLLEKVLLLKEIRETVTYDPKDIHYIKLGNSNALDFQI